MVSQGLYVLNRLELIMDATINLHGDRGNGTSPHVSRCKISNVIGLTELTTLVTALNGDYLSSNVGRHGVTEFATLDPTAPDGDVNLDEKAIIYFQHPVTGGTHSITLSGWDTSNKPTVPAADGDRIATQDVIDVVALISTATGVAYKPLWGKHIKVT